MFFSVYGSKHNKEPVDKLMYGMTLDEFLEYKTYIDIQNDYEYAIHKDQEELMKRESRQNGK